MKIKGYGSRKKVEKKNTHNSKSFYNALKATLYTNATIKNNEY